MRKGYLAIALLAGLALISSYFTFFDSSSSIKRYHSIDSRATKKVYHNNKNDIRAVLVSGPGSDVDEQRFRLSNSSAEEYLGKIGTNEIYSYQYDSRDYKRMSKNLSDRLEYIASIAEEHDITMIIFASHGNEEGTILSKRENSKYGMDYDKLASHLNSIGGYKIAIIQTCNADAFIENMFTNGKYSIFGKDCKAPYNSILLAPSSAKNKHEQTIFCTGNEDDYIPRFLKSLCVYRNVEKAFKKSWSFSDKPTMHTSVSDIGKLNDILRYRN